MVMHYFLIIQQNGVDSVYTTPRDEMSWDVVFQDLLDFCPQLLLWVGLMSYASQPKPFVLYLLAFLTGCKITSIELYIVIVYTVVVWNCNDMAETILAVSWK